MTHVAFPDGTGDNYTAVELARRIAERGYETKIITWNRRNPSTNEVENINGVETWRLAGLNLELKNHITAYPFTPKMNVALREMRPDLIHVHSHLFLTSFQAVKNGIRNGTPVVVTIHGVMAERRLFINSMQKTYLRTLGSWIFKNATMVICLTKSDANEIMKLGCPRDEIRIISNPVDVDAFRPRPELEKDNIAIWVGRFVFEKGLDTLIKAAKEVVDQNSSVRFILVGDGPLAGRVKHLVTKYQLQKNVALTGAIEPQRVNELLSKAAVFVFTSLKEGLPKVVLEAMSSGKAVVASDIPGVDEVISNGENGILIPKDDPRAFAEGICQIMDDRKLRLKLGVAARKYILQYHSWNKILDELEDTYSSLVD